jgi:hypothetical protein
MASWTLTELMLSENCDPPGNRRRAIALPVRSEQRKNARNIAERGLPFELVAQLDWETAVAVEDTRKD